MLALLLMVENRRMTGVVRNSTISYYSSTLCFQTETTSDCLYFLDFVNKNVDWIGLHHS